MGGVIMIQLAIKGHATRGKEVIELLEMLGGINKYNLRGSEDEWFVLDGTLIQRSDRLFAEKGFALEEFLEKFPYKVGDKVSSKCLKNYKIGKMEWEIPNNRVIYKLQGGGWYCADELQPYKEETMEERQYEELRIPLDDDDKLATEVTIDGNKILPPNGYLIGKITQLDNGMFVEYVKIQPQYPKTYEECLQILDLGDFNIDVTYVTREEYNLYTSFIKLKRCRDAYWKIAGEEMGIGKPWEPEFRFGKKKYSIMTKENKVTRATVEETNRILAFPTEKMRDIFHENFKGLIEQCKDLL